jgi:hypothetical protein
LRAQQRTIDRCSRKTAHLQRVHKTPALAPVFLAQGNSVHGHAAVYGFAHVVNREEADLHGGTKQGLQPVFLQLVALALGNPFLRSAPVSWFSGANFEQEYLPRWNVER